MLILFSVSNMFGVKVSQLQWSDCEVTDEVFPALLLESHLELKAIVDDQNNVVDCEPLKKKQRIEARHSILESSFSESQDDVKPEHEMSVPGSSPRISRQVITYYCYNCSYQTNLPNLMRFHLRRHGSSGAICCHTCLSKYRSTLGYEKHMLICEGGDNQRDEMLNTSSLADDQYELDSVNFKGHEMYGLAIKLKGQFRCSETVMNAIFSSIHALLGSNSVTINQLKEASENLSSQYKREKKLTDFFKIPDIISITKDQKGTAIRFLQMITFLLQSPEMIQFTTIDETRQQLDIALYCDDLGLTNPIGKSRKKHKVWLLYFKVLSIPEKYQGGTSAIFPIAVTTSKNVKDEKFMNELLKDFFDSVELLYKGHEMLIRGSRKIVTLRVKYFIADSLAANSIGGFKEGFSPKTVRPCRMCNSNYEDMKTIVSHSECNLRNIEEHNVRLSELKSGLTNKSRQFWSKVYGVRGESILAKIPEFDVTKHLTFDFMHDVLEGLLPHQLKLCLRHLINTNVINLSHLNDWIQSFKYPALMEKPPLIDINLKISGLFGSGQVLSLSRVLPFYVNKFIGVSDDHIQCVMKLIQILQLLMSPITSDTYLQSLTDLLISHHTQFMQLYPNNFIPKLHFIKHYVYQAVHFGPMRYQNCMSYERKHQVIKNFRQFNFKNVTYSGCKYLLYNTVSMFFDFDGEMKTDVFCGVDEMDMVNEKIKSTKVNGVKYNLGDVITSYCNDELHFHIIESIHSIDQKRVVTATRLDIVEYNFIFKCKKSDGQADFNVDDLVFPWTALHIIDGCFHDVLPVALPNMMQCA